MNIRLLYTLFSFALICATQSLFAQQFQAPQGYTGPLYFDKEWKKSDANRSVYMRYAKLLSDTSKQVAGVDKAKFVVNSYFHILDYYYDGKVYFDGVHMEGAMAIKPIINGSKSDLNLYGNCTWYDRNGKVLHQGQYKGNESRKKVEEEYAKDQQAKGAAEEKKEEAPQFTYSDNGYYQTGLSKEQFKHSYSQTGRVQTVEVALPEQNLTLTIGYDAMGFKHPLKTIAAKYQDSLTTVTMDGKGFVETIERPESSFKKGGVSGVWIEDRYYPNGGNTALSNEKLYFQVYHFKNDGSYIRYIIDNQLYAAKSFRKGDTFVSMVRIDNGSWMFSNGTLNLLSATNVQNNRTVKLTWRNENEFSESTKHLQNDISHPLELTFKRLHE